MVMVTLMDIISMRFMKRIIIKNANTTTTMKVTTIMDMVMSYKYKENELTNIYQVYLLAMTH